MKTMVPPKWHGAVFIGRRQRARLAWLVEFMRLWFSQDELCHMARQRLDALPTHHALDYADQVAAALPPCIETTPDNWSASPVLRAFFVRPVDVATTLRDSHDLQDFLASPAGSALDRVCCVVAATRSEQTVLGTALDGDIVRGLELLRQAVGLAPQQHAIRLNYARALIKAGKSAEARKELAELARLGDGFPAQAEVERLMKGL